LIEDFLSKKRAEIHQALNLIWSTAYKIHEKVSKKFKSSKVEFAKSSYIEVEGKWDKQLYPIPVIRTEAGEIGVNLDGVYGVIGVISESISEEFLSEILESGLKVEIYGGKDFTKTYYAGDTRISVKELLEEIKKGGEEVVQVEVRRGLSECFKIVEDLRKLREVMIRRGVKYISPLASSGD